LLFVVDITIYYIIHYYLAAEIDIGASIRLT